jgi:polysaccharide export outer membrane protein
MTAKFRSKNIANSLAGALLLAAMIPAATTAQTGQAPGAKPASVAPPPVPVGLPESVLAAIPDYVIGPEDLLTIVFWRDKDMSTDVAVRPDGKITLPLLNEVRAAGLTPVQLKDLLMEESKKYVADPNVTVVVKQINSRKVFVTGEVNKPGAYPLMAPTTVLQLIVIAGGLRDYAHSEKIAIMRTENGKPTSYRFNYKEIVNNKNLKQNIELKPGDTVIVP